LFYINKDVSQMTVAGDDNLCFVRTLAVWILAHVDRGSLRRGTFELDSAADRCCGCWVNRRGRRWGCCRTGSRGSLRSLFLAAICQQEERAHRCERNVCHPSCFFHVVFPRFLMLVNTNLFLSSVAGSAGARR